MLKINLLDQINYPSDLKKLKKNELNQVAKELREELAIFARKIASKILDPHTLEAYVACCLIPLTSMHTQQRVTRFGPVCHL